MSAGTRSGLVAGLLSALVLACGPPARRPPVAPAPGPAAAATPASDPAPSPEVVDRDIGLVVGGTFSPDHLGPEVHAEVAARVRGAAAAYLERLEAAYLAGGAPDPARLALHLPRLLELAAAAEPERAARLALRLRSAYPLAVQMAADDVDLGRRLASRLLTLDILLARLGAVPGEPTEPATPDRVCPARDDEGRSVLRAERDCSCGEPMTCRASLRGRTLDLEVLLDPSAGACEDCFWTAAVCLLPDLPASASLPVSLGGRALGSLATDAAGGLAPGDCLAAGAARPPR